MSFGVETDGDKWNKNVHYYALAGNYSVDAFSTSLIWERVTVPGVDDDQDFYSFGVSYDFGMIKPMFAYQHGQHIVASENGAYEFLLDAADDLKTDSFLLGATAPLAGGTVMASYQYLTGKLGVDEGENKFNAHVVGIAYDYPLSNRTSIYTGATWSKGGKALDKDSGSKDFNGYQFGVGLKHTF